MDLDGDTESERKEHKITRTLNRVSNDKDEVSAVIQCELTQLEAGSCTPGLDIRGKHRIKTSRNI